MADWFVSSAAYAGLTAFISSHAYSIGDIVVPTAPALKAKWVFRCTTAGTSSTEPTWPTANNATITSGGATFTNVTGQSTYAWAAAAGDVQTLLATGSPRFAGGDRIFVSSDHSETQTAASTYGSGTNAALSYSVGQVLSVNRAGSVPPVAADLTAGASIACSSGNFIFETAFPVYHYGISFTYSGLTAFYFGGAYFKSLSFDACQLYLNTASGIHFYGNNYTTVILNNTTLRFGATSQNIAVQTASLELIWLNTPSALAGAIFPTSLFGGGSGPVSVTARGVDLSALTGTLFNNGGSGSGGKFLFDSCRIASGVTRYNVASVANTRDLVELINCYDGTSIVNESYQPAGVVTTERTITLSGGATDDVGVFSHKLVSGTNIDKYVNPLTSFWMDVENTATGSSKTATVEIISSLTLNNDDISLLLEYQGTSGSSVASFANTLPTNVLTTNAAVTASTATWNSSPATPVKQRLVITFTPQVAGRVRGQVRLGRASTTVYLNPLITIA